MNTSALFTRLGLFLAVLGLAVSSSHAGQELVTNGDFTQYSLLSAPYPATPSGFGGTYSGQLNYNIEATGWTAISQPAYDFLFAAGTADTTGAADFDPGGPIALLWGPNDSSLGDPQYLPTSNPTLPGTIMGNPVGNFVAADGDVRVSPIQQTISGLTPGDSYTLSFWWAGAVVHLQRRNHRTVAGQFRQPDPVNSRREQRQPWLHRLDAPDFHFHGRQHQRHTLLPGGRHTSRRATVRAAHRRVDDGRAGTDFPVAHRPRPARPRSPGRHCAAAHQVGRGLSITLRPSRARSGLAGHVAQVTAWCAWIVFRRAANRKY